MKLTPNRWYRFDCQAARDQWLNKTIEMMPNVLINQSCLQAQALKLNTNTNCINYRTKIREDYYHLYELYTWTNNKEMEENMEPVMGTMHYADNAPKCGYYESNNPLIDNYVNKTIKQLRDKYQAERDEIIEASVVGKAARNYLNALTLQQPFSVKPELQSLVPFNFLSDAEQRHIRRLNEQEDKEIDELRTRMRNLHYLVSIADTYEQKEKLFKKYGILDTEIKTVTDKIKKSK